MGSTRRRNTRESWWVRPVLLQPFGTAELCALNSQKAMEHIRTLVPDEVKGRCFDNQHCIMKVCLVMMHTLHVHRWALNSMNSGRLVHCGNFALLTDTTPLLFTPRVVRFQAWYISSWARQVIGSGGRGGVLYVRGSMESYQHAYTFYILQFS